MEKESVTQELAIQKNQLLRIDDVSSLTTLAKSSINLWVSLGKFPKPIHLSPTVKVWLLREIDLWIENQSITQK